MIKSETYRQIPQLIYRESELGAHLTFHGAPEYSEAHLHIDADLQRNEIITLASALLGGGHFSTPGNRLKLSSEMVPGYQNEVLQISAGDTELFISGHVAAIWGRMLWLINKMPDNHLPEPPKFSVKTRGRNVQLECGELQWEGSGLHALLLSEATHQREHEEIALQGTEGWILCVGDFTGIHLMTSSAHVWLPDRQARALKSQLLVAARKQGHGQREAPGQSAGEDQPDGAQHKQHGPQELRRRPSQG